MSRKIGQIIARGERRGLVRVYLGCDREMRKRTYHSRIHGQEAFQTTPARSRFAEHPALRSPPHICHSCPNGWSRAESSVRATWTCERRVHPGHLLTRASAYAGGSCFKNGGSPAERPVVVTHFPPNPKSSTAPTAPFCEQRKEVCPCRAN